MANEQNLNHPSAGLVTGINGLLGSALTELLQRSGRSFVGVDLQAATNPALAAQHFQAVDLTDARAVERLFAECKPAWVIHGAAMTAVDACETEREAAWRVNVDATATIASWCERTGARLIYVSTDYVFDGRTGGYTPESPLNPLGVYATSKAAGEWAARTLCKNHVVARTSVPFGPYTHVKKDFVRWLREELAGQRAVRIVDDQVSNPTYAPDLARMLMALVDRPDITGVVHTCGATSLDRMDFARRVAKHFSLDASLIQAIKTAALKQASPRPLDASLSVAATQALGLEPLDIDRALQALKERVLA